MSKYLVDILQVELADCFSGETSVTHAKSPKLEEYLAQLKKSGNIHQDLMMLHSGAELHYDSTAITKERVHLHSHAFYEILFCNSGTVDYLLGGDRYNVIRGDILLIPPGVSHRPLFHDNSTEEYGRYVLWLDAGFFKNAMQNHEDLNYAFMQCEAQGTYLLRTPRLTWEGLLAGFKLLWHETQEKKLGWHICVNTGALTLMAHISRTYYYRNTQSFPVKSTGLCDDIFRYIDVNLAQKLTLQSVADQFYVSKSTISHSFSSQMGVSFYRCVIQRRLIAAKAHILHGMPLRQVWETCGFSDHASFYRLFKKEFGASPQEFRKLYSIKSHDKSEIVK